MLKKPFSTKEYKAASGGHGDEAHGDHEEGSH